MEQTLEYGCVSLYLHGDMGEIEVERLYSKNYSKIKMHLNYVSLNK